MSLLSVPKLQRLDLKKKPWKAFILCNCLNTRVSQKVYDTKRQHKNRMS